MSTNQLKLAETGTVSPEMIEVAAAEGMEAESVRTRVANGQIVILTGRFNEKKVVGVGKGLRTKVNAAIGTSSSEKGCSMCGEFCALKNAAVSLNTFLKGDKCNS